MFICIHPQFLNLSEAQSIPHAAELLGHIPLKFKINNFMARIVDNTTLLPNPYKEDMHKLRLSEIEIGHNFSEIIQI